MVNQMKSCGGTPFDWLKDRTLKFLLFSGMSFVFGSLLRITGSLGPVNEVVQFSLYQSGVHFLLTFGVFGFSCIGALYFIVPKLLGHEWPSTGLVKLHHLLTIGGVLLTGVALCVGGYWQGKALNLGKTSLIEIGQNLKPFLGLNLVASLMLLAGSVVFLGHFAWACFRAARHCCWSDTCCKGGQS